MSGSTSSTAPCDPLTEEAIAWFVRMHSDQRTLADEDRFSQWLKQEPRHAQAYLRVEELWRAAGPQLVPRPLAGADNGSDEWKRSARTGWQVIGALAAGVAALAVALVLGLPGHEGVAQGTFATQPGAQRQLELADGSRIVLNTRSEVVVSLTKAERTVRLTRGEARFEVAEDAQRPFTVDAGAARVRAVGTAFDVQVSQTRLIVTLVEGRVEVTPLLAPGSPPTVLTAGQQLALELDTFEQHIDTIDLARANAWLQQRLIFDAVPLAAAVAEASRYLPTPIVIEDAALSDMRVSGVVTAGNVESFVASLEASFPVVARQGPEGQILLNSRAHPNP